MPVPDSYPYPDLEPLDPLDPTPNPFEDPRFEQPAPTVIDLGPLNPQPRIPTANAIWPADFEFQYEVVFVDYGYEIGTFAAGNFIPQDQHEVVFAEANIFEHQFEVEFIPRPEFFAEEQHEVEFVSATVEPGLYAYWKLNNSSWADEQPGANDFTASGTVNLYYDSLEGRNVPELGWYTNILDGGGYYYDAGGMSGYLSRSGGNFDIFPSGGNQSFKVTFDMYLADRQELVDTETGATAPYTNYAGTGHILTLTDQFEIYVEDQLDGTSIITFKVGIGETSTTFSATTLIDRGEWTDIECEVNFDTDVHTIRVNGVATNNTSAPGYLEQAPGNLWVGYNGTYNPPQNLRLKELKFYKYDLIPR